MMMDIRRFRCKSCDRVVGPMLRKPSWECTCGALQWVAVRKRTHRYLYKLSSNRVRR